MYSLFINRKWILIIHTKCLLQNQFDKTKLDARAQRFGMNPSLTDEQVQELYKTLGITSVSVLEVRLDSIFMCGTKEMSTEDVFGYFERYDPVSVEWIDDDSCNVVWGDDISAAGALHGMSKGILGVPVGRSVLLRGNGVGMVDISEIKTVVPPGYWRLGVAHTKAKYLLLRYALKGDKTPLRVEKFGELYGGIEGLISDSRKRILKGISTNSRELLLSKKPVISGNPWGSLARNWSRGPQERFRESERIVTHQSTNVSKSILQRLGANKRSRSPTNKDEVETDEEKMTKKSKVPRMRMYADEEQKKIENQKQLKKIRQLEEIQRTSQTIVPDLRNRLGKQNNPLTHRTILLKNRSPINSLTGGAAAKPPIRRRNEHFVLPSDTSEGEDADDLDVQQKSKVTVIIRKNNAHRPAVASTVWSRLENKNRQLQSKISASKARSDSESKSSNSDDSSEEDSSENDSSEGNGKPMKAPSQRPGFQHVKQTEKDHKSPLRIEINNDHFKHPTNG